MLKDRLSKTSGWQFHNVFSSPKSFRDFRETGSRGPGIDTEFKKKKKQYLLAEVLLIAQWTNDWGWTKIVTKPFQL